MSIRQDERQEDEADGSPAPALDRGLAMLECIRRAPEGMTCAELVAELGLPFSSAGRFLSVLAARGYVRQDGTGAYRIGPALIRLRHEETVFQRLKRCAAEELTRLRDETGNTAILIGWDGVQFHCLAKVMHEMSLVMQNVGEVRNDVFAYPWSAFLAGALSPEELDVMVKRHGVAAKRKIELRRWRQEANEQGYVFVQDAFRRLAAPVVDAEGRFCAAVGLGASETSLPDSRVSNAGKMVARCARVLSDALSKG